MVGSARETPVFGAPCTIGIAAESNFWSHVGLLQWLGTHLHSGSASADESAPCPVHNPLSGCTLVTSLPPQKL